VWWAEDGPAAPPNHGPSLCRSVRTQRVLIVLGAGGQEVAQQHPKSWPYYQIAHPEVVDPPTISFAKVDAVDFLTNSREKLGRNLHNIHAVAPKVMTRTTVSHDDHVRGPAHPEHLRYRTAAVSPEGVLVDLHVFR
jgi:hypothetical protein